MLSREQSKELHKVDRRIEFHLAKNPKNGFNNSSLLSKLTSTNKFNSDSSKKSICRDLFDPEIVKSLLNWQNPRRIGPGFFNQGNTCYLNSTLQCLLYIPPLTQILLKTDIKLLKSVSANNQSMLPHFQKLAIDVSKGSAERAISPRSMVQNIRYVGKQFRPMRQEDAHEYLCKLIDCMHEEILKSYGVKIENGKIAETTFIFRIFGGTLRNELLCSKCHYSSKTYNSFLNLSLEISKGVSSVNAALKHFTEKERLTAGNEWFCEKCKMKVTATKQLTINHAPQVLVLHLKRFCHLGMFNTKVNKRIDFDLELKVNCSGETPSVISYKLVGLIRHYGNSSHSGHYVAFVLSSNGQWFEMNDSNVTAISAKRVLEQEAYVLFYVRSTDDPSTSNLSAQVVSSSSASVHGNGSNEIIRSKPISENGKLSSLDLGEKLSKVDLATLSTLTNQVTPEIIIAKKLIAPMPAVENNMIIEDEVACKGLVTLDYSGHIRIPRLNSTCLRPMR